MSVFEVGQKVTIRPAYRMPDRIGGEALPVPDEATGEWFVLEVCEDGDLGLARHADDWGPGFWVTSARAFLLPT